MPKKPPAERESLVDWVRKSQGATPVLHHVYHAAVNVRHLLSIVSSASGRLRTYCSDRFGPHCNGMDSSSP